MPDPAVELSVNGTPIGMPRGSTVAAAVFAAGLTAFRHSASGEPRAPLCGMGICFECAVIVDGRRHSRSCQLVCESGMDVRTDE